MSPPETFRRSTAHSHSSTSNSPTMSPQPPSIPKHKMSNPARTTSLDTSLDGIRKRVCKACDRCRLKKSKCDGASPCSRCKADNSICMFGERKKSHDKVYPKGYVEMLEEQQSQLVGALQEMYRQASQTKSWNGVPLTENNGHVLTHDILAGLGLLLPKRDGSDEEERFEEDCEKLQQRLLAGGAPYVPRRASLSSESELDQQEHFRPAPSPRKISTSPHKISTSPQSMSSMHRAHLPPRDSFTLSAPVSPMSSQSPIKRQRISYPIAQPSPLQQNSPIINDAQFYQSQWAIGNPDMSAIMRAPFSMETPTVQQQLSELDHAFLNSSGFDGYDSGINAPMPFYQPQAMNTFNPGMLDFNGEMDPMDMELSCSGGLHGMATTA